MRILLIFLMVFCTSLSAEEPRVPTSTTEIALSFAPLVRQAAPAVVNIYASRVVQASSPFQGDPIFGDFFREFGQARPRVQNSLGSGVILSADGIVVSNYHVVGQATDIRVVLNDRREFSASVLLGDEESDLAILRIDGGEGMPHLDLRDSDTVEVGELALAIGNPFGVGQTVSSGIVSGLARSGTATGNARGYFIQTDAPINPGNSGGALIDMAGRLIGVNTSILTRSGGSNGIGFAIPSALVAQFVDQARAGKTGFGRPWAGIGGQPVDAQLSESLGLIVPGGIVISDLHEQSPFRAAGFDVGDVVLAVDSQPVNTPPEMIYRMSVRGIGATAQVTRARDGVSETLPVQMIAPPEVPARDLHILAKGEVLPGLQVVNINPAVIAEFGLPLTADGVVVQDPGPYAARAGLRAGDILRAVNGDDVESADQIAPALERAAPRIAIEAQRGAQRVLLRFRV
ncbi:trypsin-like peptidase domain-containing protein [Puniceibacterium sp. IMCC21224]|uniref:trypsin-like peptidase domain-containing protein n=1 Tax=Puniceibacterium sp. IMCC21224 TaxID=1618204 RepID=UPI00064E0EDB|nr:trypsin-like peptidase domain-containing protein [Puniceibacterium sp. IMCC21224]KMK68236.1 trypsin-like serine protease with C-terminal PDZ domain [Puniceibacterium sp. IMCC21224]